MRPAIIADDLTGACDSAARAAMAGWRPLVLPAGVLGGTGPDSADSETGLVVVSTATRNQPRDRAAKAVGEVARALLARGVFPCFKKIDSTLRGPWAAEVASLREVIEAQVVAVAPAFPACGRIVRDGTVYADGELVGALAPALAAAGIGDVLIQDAESDQELAAFVESVVQRRATVLWVGSAGLARFAFGQAPAGEQVRRPQTAAARWLIVAGSTHAATLVQVEAARAAGGDAVGAVVEVISQVPKALERDTDSSSLRRHSRGRSRRPRGGSLGSVRRSPPRRSNGPAAGRPGPWRPLPQQSRRVRPARCCDAGHHPRHVEPAQAGG